MSRSAGVTLQWCYAPPSSAGFVGPFRSSIINALTTGLLSRGVSHAEPRVAPRPAKPRKPLFRDTASSRMR